MTWLGLGLGLRVRVRVRVRVGVRVRVSEQDRHGEAVEGVVLRRIVGPGGVG